MERSRPNTPVIPTLAAQREVDAARKLEHAFSSPTSNPSRGGIFLGVISSNQEMKVSPILLALLTLATQSEAETYFSYDSSPTTWVGLGFTDYIVSPDTGWTITASRNFANGVTFDIRRDGGRDPDRPDYYWTLNLAAPGNEILFEGDYLDTARFPFQEADEPGLTLSGNHRGNNQNGGFFEVLQADYAPDGEVLRFAADFTQYGERSQSRWIVGKIRYNFSSEPPEDLAITSMTFTPEGLRLSITRPAFGSRVGIEYSPDMSPGSWMELGNFFQAGGVWTFTDPDLIRRERPAGFYRAFLRPAVP